jgi:hypothetical protein
MNDSKLSITVDIRYQSYHHKDLKDLRRRRSRRTIIITIEIHAPLSLLPPMTFRRWKQK